jgi:hypothetical protein
MINTNKDYFMKDLSQDQRGVAMVLEIGLVAVVLVVMAGAFIVAGQHNKPVSVGEKSTQVTTPAPAGNAEATSAAIASQAAEDSAAVNADDTTTPGTDLQDGSATNMETSFDENSF